MRRGWRGGGAAAIGALGAAFYMNGGGGRPPQTYAGSGAANAYIIKFTVRAIEM